MKNLGVQSFLWILELCIRDRGPVILFPFQRINTGAQRDWELAPKVTQLRSDRARFNPRFICLWSSYSFYTLSCPLPNLPSALEIYEVCSNSSPFQPTVIELSLPLPSSSLRPDTCIFLGSFQPLVFGATVALESSAGNGLDGWVCSKRPWNTVTQWSRAVSLCFQNLIQCSKL